ncbi:DEAD/DEAH box helicase [Candidatus Peregrinibacteria bacterium]|nr:DEAD/DEAH box helicase [Candidatus Peregrinibacteria bacterium]
MYIALDIETTGLSYENDEIIEIGAVKFDETGIAGKYKTLIKASQPLQPLITHITGITDDDLKDAPSLEDVAEHFLDFIEDLPIVGHNISFDLDFLKTKGFPLTNISYDTLQLAAILMPGEPSYSLELLTKKLKIKHKHKHRAYDDAVASMDLFNILINKITEIDPDVLDEIKFLSQRSKWALKDIFNNSEPKNAQTAVTKDNLKKNSKPAQALILPFDKDEIIKLYDENGPLSKCEKDYEARPSQKKMTELIIDAFNENSNLLCEAGTGTGKSIAYILPAVFWSVSQREQVVIATHTKNLQDQLANKDIPVVEKTLKLYNKDLKFKTAVIKGRNNYLSEKRLENFKQKNFFLDHEITLLIKVLIWLKKTKTGDKEELSLQGREYYSWNDISCDMIKCPHNDPEYKNSCWLAKAREKAQTADIIITNHSLLLSDTITPQQVLPEYKYLIIDEAHHLEEEATNAFTINATYEIYTHPLISIKSLLKSNKEIISEIENLENKIEIFFGIIGIFFEKFKDYATSIFSLTIKKEFINSFEWQKACQSAENILAMAENIITKINLAADPSVNKPEIEREIMEFKEHMANLSIILANNSSQEYSNQITWIYQKPDGHLGIKSCPVYIGNHLSGTLFHEKNSIIMTSATLTVNKEFTFIKNQLKLEEKFKEVILPSHFSFPDQVEIVIYSDLKAPQSPGYFNQTADIIYNTALENHGKMLVLFTSKKAIEATYLKLAPVLKEKGITILAQNMSGGRGKIIELFKQDPENSIIFGTNSFWEGIDIKGKALNYVIIQKLPFDPPDDPIHKARSELYAKPFEDYQTPRAILLFKQGFGRLIRSTQDSGKVAILDSRIIQKSYGKVFLDSLPEGIKVNYKMIN